MRIHSSGYARSEYHTQLPKVSFDKIFDLTAGVYLYFYNNNCFSCCGDPHFFLIFIVVRAMYAVICLTELFSVSELVGQYYDIAASIMTNDCMLKI